MLCKVEAYLPSLRVWGQILDLEISKIQIKQIWGPSPSKGKFIWLESLGFGVGLLEGFIHWKKGCTAEYSSLHTCTKP